MAEQEVIKHTKKVYKIWSGKHSFWHKAKEFLIEILIIVFAVSLSIWFHNRSEHAHQQKEVKHFLLGLKSDLKNDLEEMKTDQSSYVSEKATFKTIVNVNREQGFHSDSLSTYWKWIFNTTALNPNNGRFEGFKSSGKLATIENEELQNDIVDFYTEDLVILLNATNAHLEYKRKLFDFIFANAKKVTDAGSLNNALMRDEAQNICLFLSTPDWVISSYQRCIDRAKKIVAEIEKEYQSGT